MIEPIRIRCSSELARRLGALRVPDAKVPETADQIAATAMKGMLNCIVITNPKRTELWLWPWAEGVFDEQPEGPPRKQRFQKG